MSKSVVGKIIGVIAIAIVCLAIYQSYFNNKQNENTDKKDENIEEIKNDKLTEIDSSQKSKPSENSNTNDISTLREIEETVNVQREMIESKKTTDYETYELENGKKVKIIENPERADYYTNGDVSKAMNTSTKFVYKFMNFEEFEAIKILDKIKGSFGSTIRTELTGIVDKKKIPSFEDKEINHGESTYGHSEFPIKLFLEMNNGVVSRKVTDISLEESGSFSPPFLDIYATVKSTVTLKDGSTREDIDNFIFVFNKQQERYRSIFKIKFTTDLI
ncbi:hypothetical protein ABD87_14730 [Lysinibacillus sphaericus]|uniref:hypothetical protein n=1 Tax=Lysinibacillus sphaericus TaxID=1421 RepID=UPI0018CE587C|nr:hypothetical protein [Lysinibacillus sphaericus]MBG9730754.1 hypothetical protein [Lysinibacillus sphaericus]